jgi:hypothetical protein
MRIRSFRSFSALKGLTVVDRDGEAGTIQDAYFDNLRWVIRYLLLDHRISGKSVLISPLIIDDIHWPQHRIWLRLYDEELEAVPAVDTAKPITREQEETYNEYFFIPDYWEGDSLWGENQTPGEFGTWLRSQQHKSDTDGGGESYLLSASDVQQYDLETPQGTAGTVGDFLWTPETFAIRYLVVDIGTLAAGRKKVLLSPLWIKDLDRHLKKFFVDLPKTALEESPLYQMGEPITPAYEKNLMSHYNALEYKN